jgi:transcriptional regulator, PadR family
MTQTDTEATTVRAADLSAFQREALLAIARLETDDEESYGLGIKRALEHRLGEDVNHGQLYPNLDELIELGLLEKSELDRRTNEYLLTDAGRRLLTEYRDHLDDIVETL